MRLVIADDISPSSRSSSPSTAKSATHANISITFDRYGHLMPGSETGAAQLLDAYLAAPRERINTQARMAAVGVT